VVGAACVGALGLAHALREAAPPANACGHWAPAAHTFAIEPGNDVVASFKAVAVEGRSVALREEADGDAPGAIRA
jgi:predicted thioesterase